MLPSTNNIYNNIAGKPGLTISTILMLGMAILSFFSPHQITNKESFGIIFNSVALWQLPDFTAWCLNTILILFTAAAGLILNNEFRFFKIPNYLYSSAFLIITASNPWLTASLCDASIMVLVITICTGILFSQYGKHNASAAITSIFSILALGSMFQYAYILLMPIFILGAIFLNILRFKECVAAILGIIAPYWIGFGLNIITPSDIHIPSLSNLFFTSSPPSDIFPMLVEIGLTIIIAIILTLNNAPKLLATDNKNRSYNSFFILLEIAMIWFIIFDYTNMLTYITTLNMVVGLQMSFHISLSKVRNGVIIYSLLAATYISIFFTIIYD